MNTWAHGIRVIRSEAGVEIIEFVGLLPILLAVFAMSVQVILAGQTFVVAASAAREGARALAVCEDAKRAAQFASPGYDGRRTVEQNVGDKEVSVTVWLDVPIIFNPYIPMPKVQVHNTVTMMKEVTRPCRK